MREIYHASSKLSLDCMGTAHGGIRYCGSATTSENSIQEHRITGNSLSMGEKRPYMPSASLGEQNTKYASIAKMGEGRKRVVAIIAGIIVARHLDTADDLFGGPQGSPRTDKMISAAVQWATLILQKIDRVFS